MSKFKIFYSWQSDLPEDTTKNFIWDCIGDAIDFAEETTAIKAERDEATKDTTGSPNIVTSLFSKIDECDLFVADVSLCFTGDVKKQHNDAVRIKRSPNPNVLIELGYAVKTLSWDRVICICNTDYGTDFPFDIAQNKMIKYNLDGKDKQAERRVIRKKIFENICQLQGQPPRVKAGMAAYIVGTYDFDRQKVIGKLLNYEIGKSESYLLYNEELLEEVRQLVDYIQLITEVLLSEREIKEPEEPLSPKGIPANSKLSQYSMENTVFLNISDTFKTTETPVIYGNAEQDRERINRWLNIDVSDAFFDLGDLKKITQAFTPSVSYSGTMEEKTKYKKLRELSNKLKLLDIRQDYLKTFDGMYFIPLAIQNISEIQDKDIHVVVKVETGEIVDPGEHLIVEHLEGQQGLICRNDEDDRDIGLIAELFIIPEDGIIHTEISEPGMWMPRIPVFNGHGFSQPEKTETDYEIELKEFITSSEGRDYYEYDVKSLNPKECCWLSTGMLIKPVDSSVVISYRVFSARSNGETRGILKWPGDE